MRAGPLRPIARRALAAQSDDRLVGLVREGHEPAFEEIVRRYRGPLVAFATAIVSHHRAEDVVQASLEKAHRALLGGQTEINLRPWLFAIVRNGSLNVVRDEPVATELAPDLAGGVPLDEVAEQRDELDRLVTAICALPRAQREALVRREIDGAGHADIAAQLGTSATAVRGLIFRARTTLRDAVGLLVPLPLLRLLLSNDGTAGAAGAATVGAAGAGATVLGAAGAKGGLAVAAAVAALAAGVAIESDSAVEPAERADAAQADVRERSAARGEARASGPSETRVDARGGSGPGSDDSGSGRSGSGDDSGDDHSGPGGGGDDDSGDDDNSGPGSDDGPDDDGDDNSGSGSGDDDGDDDNSGSGSGDDDRVDNSGPGSYDGSDDDDGDNSGPGGGGDDGDDDAAPPPPPPDDSSGPGDGSFDDDGDDNSGSGSGDSGSGSDDDD